MPKFDNGGIIVHDTPLFASSIATKHVAMMAIRQDGQIIASEVSGVVFKPGIYRSKGPVKLAAGKSVTLDARYEANPLFLFQCNTLSFGASTSVILTNGAKPQHVLWVIDKSVSIGATSSVQGSMLSGGGVDLGAEVKIHGCVIGGADVTLAANVKIGAVKPELCRKCPPGTNSSTASPFIDECRCRSGHEAESDGVICIECATGEYKPLPGIGN